MEFIVHHYSEDLKFTPLSCHILDFYKNYVFPSVRFAKLIIKINHYNFLMRYLMLFAIRKKV